MLAGSRKIRTVSMHIAHLPSAPDHSSFLVPQRHSGPPRKSTYYCVCACIRAKHSLNCGRRCLVCMQRMQLAAMSLADRLAYRAAQRSTALAEADDASRAAAAQPPPRGRQVSKRAHRIDTQPSCVWSVNSKLTHFDGTAPNRTVQGTVFATANRADGGEGTDLVERTRSALDSWCASCSGAVASQCQN